MAKNTELVSITQQYVALSGGGAGSALAIVRENLGGEQLSPGDLEKITVPTGGQKFLAVGEEGKPAVRGVILGTQAQRAYWVTAFEESGGGSPPDCYSTDQVTGIGKPGGECNGCPLAQWGSDPKGGSGQACRAFRTVFVLTPDSPLPYLMTVPPTSLQGFKKYLLSLGLKSLRPIEVVTEFSVEVDKSATGIAYGKIIPKLVRSLEPAERGAVATYAAAMTPHLQRVSAQAVAESGGI